MPYRPSSAWMFAAPANDPPPYDPIDDISWAAQYLNDTTDSFVKPADNPAKQVIKQLKNTAGPTIKPALGTDSRAVTYASLLSDIQQIIQKYRSTSLEHSAIRVDAQLAERYRNEFAELTPALRIRVLFANYRKELTRVCRWQFRKDHCTRKVTVREKGRWMPLAKSLALNFPPGDAMVDEDTMKTFWASNGRAFNWSGLPTELKEHVIQFCITSLTVYDDGFHELPRAKSVSVRDYLDGKQHRCEVVQKLGDWKYLLLVSTQIRALTLRLCFNGSITYPQGFCITTARYSSFDRRLRRLDGYHQTTEPDSVVKADDRASSQLAWKYKKFPKIYPELERFATFKHGIRKIRLQFDFLSYLYFFKVTIGGIDRVRQARYVRCDVFTQLPNLNELVIDLPTDYDRVQGRLGPLLFHPLEPCPRILNRLIHERIATELAPYNNVTVRFFIDTDEEQRFQGLRESARLALRFTPEELDELYADVEGGVELDDEDFDFSGDASQTSTIITPMQPTDNFFPPRCQCSYPCDRLFRDRDLVASYG